MFQHYKFAQRTGIIWYENDSVPILESGLKTMKHPAFITGSARFVVSKRNTERIPEKGGIRDIDVLLCQFGWDEIRKLSSGGIAIEIGKTKLLFDNTWFRAINVNDFGQTYNRTYKPIGILEVRFERERDSVN